VSFSVTSIIASRSKVHVSGREERVLFALKDGIYRTCEDGSCTRLLEIRDVFQIDVLEKANLFLFIAGKNIEIHTQ
jgi:hypothetical protein